MRLRAAELVADGWPVFTPEQPLRVLLSACLTGAPCGYDGSSYGAPFAHLDRLLDLPNVIITPHVSANTPLAEGERNTLLRENLRRYVAGEPMLAVVDPERGY